LLLFFSTVFYFVFTDAALLVTSLYVLLLARNIYNQIYLFFLTNHPELTSS